MKLNNLYILSLSIIIVSCGGGGGNNKPEPNIPPVVDFIAPSEVAENSSVVLISNSIDPDGSIQSHEWSQISGPLVILSPINTTSVSFISPDVSTVTNLTFLLSVTDNQGAVTSSEDILVKVMPSMADNSLITDNNILLENLDSPFLNMVEIDNIIEDLESITYKILSRPESIVNNFTVTHFKEKLNLNNEKIIIPVIGFYEDYLNQLDFIFTFTDGSQKIISKQHQTSSYDASTKIEVVLPPNDTVRPSFDYFYLKRFGGPMLVDIDGYTRWINTQSSWSMYFDDEENQFYFGLQNKIGKLKLDGTIEFNEILSDDLLDIEVHHEVSKGKVGHLVEINASYDGKTQIIESILIEVDSFGNILNTWDMGKIFRQYMISNSDDPSNFVIDGEDWCHMNSSIYNPQDNSILISCREDFVAKIDYTSKEIIWLLGDETKHWYVNFPSLQDLSLNSLDTKPIGQHSLSIYDGHISLFNNGFNSFRQPEGAPNGINLSESRATIYEINESENTATAIFDYTDSKYSDICSSFYSDPYSDEKDFLVLFTAVNRVNLDEEWYSSIQGINSNKQKLFELKIPKERGVNQPCRDGWNAQIFSSNVIFN